MKEKKRARFSALVLAALLALTCAVPAQAEEAERTFEYDYVLVCREDGVKDGKAVLDLYVTVVSTGTEGGSAAETEPAGPFLDAGAFGLRFPEWAACKFAPSDEIVVRGMVPEKRLQPGETVNAAIERDTYHGFSWTGVEDEEEVISPNWQYEADCGGYALRLGTYTLTLPALGSAYRLPGAEDVGQLNWLDAEEAVAKELGETAANPTEPLNLTLWNPETELYQGYYEDKDSGGDKDYLLEQTDIGFRFTPPASWQSMLQLTSYDPKDGVLVYLYKEGAEEAAYTLYLPGEETGVGLYTRTLPLDGDGYLAGRHQATDFTGEAETISAEALATGTYRLEIVKQSHVKATCTGVTVGEDGLFPELVGVTIVLPCGDVDGNGQIRQADRAKLTAPTRYGKGAKAGEPYDLDGDGRVNQKDLAILIAPENYGKDSLRIDF